MRRTGDLDTLLGEDRGVLTPNRHRIQWKEVWLESQHFYSQPYIANYGTSPNLRFLICRVWLVRLNLW